MLYLVLSILRFAYLPIRIQAISSPKKTEYTDLPGGIIFRTFVRQNFKRTQGDGGIASFFLPQLSDDLLLIENNPVSRSERKAEATADRAVYRPQFNYLWCLLLAGRKGCKPTKRTGCTPQEMAHTRASPFHKPFFEIADTDFTDQYFLRHRDDQVERQAAVKPQVCIPDRFPGNKETGFITFLLFQCPQQTPDPGLLSDSGSGGPRLEQRCSIES